MFLNLKGITPARLLEMATEDENSKTFALESSILARAVLSIVNQRPDVVGPFDVTFIGPGVWAGIIDELPPGLVDQKVWITTLPPDYTPGGSMVKPYAWVTEREGDPSFPRLHLAESDADALISKCDIDPPITKRGLYTRPQRPVAWRSDGSDGRPRPVVTVSPVVAEHWYEKGLKVTALGEMKDER